MPLRVEDRVIIRDPQIESIYRAEIFDRYIIIQYRPETLIIVDKTNGQVLRVIHSKDLVGEYSVLHFTFTCDYTSVKIICSILELGTEGPREVVKIFSMNHDLNIRGHSIIKSDESLSPLECCSMDDIVYLAEKATADRLPRLYVVSHGSYRRYLMGAGEIQYKSLKKAKFTFLINNMAINPLTNEIWISLEIFLDIKRSLFKDRESLRKRFLYIVDPDACRYRTIEAESSESIIGFDGEGNAYTIGRHIIGPNIWVVSKYDRKGSLLKQVQVFNCPQAALLNNMIYVICKDNNSLLTFNSDLKLVKKG